MVKLRVNRDYRKEKKSTVIAGFKLIKELASEINFNALVLADETPEPDFFPKNVPIYRMPLSLLKKISGLENPEPCLAEVELPEESKLTGINFLIVLDGVSDPGNLGTLIRTALALGWEGVFLAPNCTDPFNEKAVRAAKGATFRIPLKTGSWEDLNEVVRQNKMKAYLADVRGSPLQETKCKPPLVLILSNESQGASNEAKKLAEPLSIPMSEKMESLNVAIAGAIFMYLIKTDVR